VTALSTDKTYTYDANGNTLAPGASAGVTTRVEGGITYTQTFRQAQCGAFDAENRLISITAGGLTTQFIYDGDGNPSTGSGQAQVESTKWTRTPAVRW